MITKKDVLDALGIEMEQDRFLTGMLMGVGIGALCGSVAALLLAPKSGSDLREQLVGKGREFKDQLRERVRGSKYDEAGESGGIESQS